MERATHEVVAQTERKVTTDGNTEECTQTEDEAKEGFAGAVKPADVPVEFLPHFLNMATQGGCPTVQHLGTLMTRKLLCVKKKPHFGASSASTPEQDTLREKELKDTLLSQKRRGPGTLGLAPQDALNVTAYTENTNPTAIPRELLPQFVELVKHQEANAQYHGTLMIRKLLSVKENPPIDEVISSGVGPIFVQFLQRSESPKLQFEAAWALNNIASGFPQHTTYVISIDAAPPLVSLLDSPDADCKGQAALALGNLVGESAKCRDYVLSLGVVDPLLRVLCAGVIGAQRDATWALSNLCRSKPRPKLEKIAKAIPMFVALLNYDDEEIQSDAAWAISFLSDRSNEHVQRILAHNPIPRLVTLLASPNTALYTPAIDTIGNIVTGTDAQTQMVIDAGALPNFHQLLSHPKRRIRKEVCWTLSNITAGTKEQKQAVIYADLIPALLQSMFAPEYMGYEVRKQAVWAIANLIHNATTEQVEYLVSVGALDKLCELLSMFDAKIIAVALEAIENILGFGEQTKKDKMLDENPYAEQLLRNGGRDKIKVLLAHPIEEVSSRVNSLLEGYYAEVPPGKSQDAQPKPDQ